MFLKKILWPIDVGFEYFTRLVVGVLRMIGFIQDDDEDEEDDYL